MKIKWISSLIILILTACSHPPTDLEFALNLAGANRGELEKVIRLYQDEPLKLKAACYLIENMPYYQYPEGPALEKYYTYYRLMGTGNYSAPALVDSLNRLYGNNILWGIPYKKDILEVDSGYLVNNIEWAFKVWQEQPWGAAIDFDTFCRSILPYRIQNEVLPHWREEFYHMFNPMLDGIRELPEASDPLYVAGVLLDSLARIPVHFTGFLPVGPHLGPGLENLRGGTCREFTDMVTYAFRSVGIPCDTDFFIVYGDNNAGHYWNIIHGKDNKKMYFEFPHPMKEMSELVNPKGKVYRRTFHLNREMYNKTGNNKAAVYPFFRYPLAEDVTEHYTNQTKSLHIPREKFYEKTGKNEIIYLCLSNRRHWIPITWSRLSEKQVIFDEVEGDVVFRLATWRDNELRFLSDPFLMDKETGSIRFFEGNNDPETIKLLFKYNLYMEYYLDNMAGGVIEGSHLPDFSQCDTLYYIQERPERLFNTVQPATNKKYRYVRYYGPENSHSDIAELTLYDENHNKLTGKTIGTPGCLDGDGSHEYTNVFDSDPYTSFNYKEPSGGWAGLDLGSPKQISKLVYTPRNRDNFIREGDTYELFYWKNRTWHTCGLRTATSDSLLYQVPRGSLLYLKNHTRGVDERIFEYKDGKQLFW